MLIIEDKKAIATIKVGPKSTQFLSMIEGRKKFLNGKQLRFEPTGYNIETYKELFPNEEIDDRRSPIDVDASGFFDEVIDEEAVVKMMTAPFAKHQEEAFRLSKDKSVFALLMEQGTGKTWVALRKMLQSYVNQKIEAALVLSPKGVHEQWVYEQVPEHVPEDFDIASWAWHKGEYKRWGFPSSIMDRGSLSLLTMNIDSVSSKMGYDAALKFIKAHGQRVMMIIDESQDIKNNNALRTKRCYDLGGLCSHRMILSGTPQSKNVIDQWSQYKFLDERIIGERYKTTFRNKYCVTVKGQYGPKIVGHKNLELFRKKVAPYTYRVTKKEALDLPPKIYERWSFDLDERNRKKYQELKKNCILMMDDGEIATVENAAVLLMRLQQLTCGWLVDGDTEERAGRERINALKECIDSRHDDKFVIWARFHHDIEDIKELYGKEAVTYYGKNSAKENAAAKERFMDPDSGVRFFVSNPAAGGVGLNLQGQTNTVIYYSNSFNAIDRWQSEDRTHRIGTVGAVEYVDLVCRKTVDSRILSNLKKKKDISELTLGDIREIIEEAA